MLILLTLIMLHMNLIHMYSIETTNRMDQVLVNPVLGLPEDFIRGVDASEAPWIIELGGKYYSVDGVEKDLLDILWENGVTWIRLRLWNDPYDEYGNPYGGGNCDLSRVSNFAARAKAKGFRVLLDFHYSDWWADPSKQVKPKAWVNLDFNNLVIAVYNWTYNALLYMQERNATPDMVQVGNEINYGFLWPEGRAENWTQFITLLKSAIKAIRDFDPSIKVVIHLSGVRADFYVNFIDRLIASNVDFEIIAISFYPYWHGSMNDFRNLLKTLSEKYDKDIIVAETAYAWTLEDYDGHPNLFGSKDQEVRSGYRASIQGQATFIRDLIEILYSETRGKGLGIFYWGAAWIPHPGAGWKTGEGNPWENQALFDFGGKALPSLKVFKLIYEGSPFDITPLELYDPTPINVVTYVNAKPNLPDTVLVFYSDHSIRSTKVEWGEIPIYSSPGLYTHKGYVVNTTIEVVVKISVQERLAVDILDYKNDDNGIGTYGYPTAAVYKPGVFDITRATIEVLGEEIVIRIYFEDLGGNPWNGPNGFSLQYTQMYIRTTNPTITNRIYRKDTFGLNVELREDYAWQYALLISPGWGSSPLIEGELSTLYYSSGQVFVEDKDFAVSANLGENYIEVRAHRTLFPDWENMKYWKILIFVTSWAGENPDRIRGFAPGGGEWIVDATAYADPGLIPKIASAIMVGVLPKFLDFAIYSEEYPGGITDKQQFDWSIQFDPATGKLATIPPIELPSITYTLTTTITKTNTITEILTVTEPSAPIPYTQITLFTLISLFAGIVAGYFLGKKFK